MKKFILIQILLFSFFVGQSQGIQRWFENFEGEANGAVSGTAAGTPGGTWSVTTTPSGGAATFSKQNLGFNRFTINQTGTEGVWTSSVVDITSTGRAALDVSLVSYYAGTGDYVRAYYKLDGGPEVLFGESLGQTGAYNITSQASIVLTGNSVQIIIRGRENTAGSTGGFPNMMRFDDVEITQVSTLFSRNGGGNWGTSGTWSTIGLGGASCGCTPDNTTNVVVGNNDVVTITAASEAINVTVQNSSTLRWSANSALTISRGGSISVSDNASVNRNGNNGAQLVFPVAAAVGITVNSSNANALAIGDILVSGDATLTISGTSSISIADDFLVSGAATIANNLSGTIAVSDALTINPVSGASFTNAGLMTIGGVTSITSPSVFTNNNIVTMSSTGAAALAGTGTFTQGIGSTLNYAGSTLTVTTLNASADNNTVNYNRAGDATLKDPSSSTYYNLTLSGSGVKSSGGNHNIDGNLTIAGTAQFNVNTGTDDISVGGNWTVTSANADPFVQGTRTVTFDGTTAQALTTALAAGETFNNLTINNTFVTSPQITFNSNVTVAGALTMTDGNVNLNGNSITLTSSAAGALSHAGASANGWIYGGSMIRAYPNNTAIAIGNVRGFFPLGSASDWRPFYVATPAATAGTGGSVTVTHVNATTTSIVSIADTGPVTITRRHDSRWAVSTSGITAVGTPWSLQAGGTNFGTIQETGDLRMATSSGVVGTNSAASGGPTDWRVNRTLLTSAQLANNFHVASTDATNSPLPVILVYFRANVFNAGVTLSWKTASELNNDYFVIERSIDGELFTDINRVKGKGTTNQSNTYSSIDFNPIVGKAYYRLKQVDFDGTSSFSELQLIEFSEPELPILKLYPNPFNGQSITLELLNTKATEEIPFVLINEAGVTVQRFMASAHGRFLKTTLEFSTPLKPGIYFLKIGDNSFLTTKLVVN